MCCFRSSMQVSSIYTIDEEGYDNREIFLDNG